MVRKILMYQHVGVYSQKHVSESLSSSLSKAPYFFERCNSR